MKNVSAFFKEGEEEKEAPPGAKKEKQERAPPAEEPPEAKLMREVGELLDRALTEVTEAKRKGARIGDAEKMLREAQALRDEGEYEKAKEIAECALKEAERALRYREVIDELRDARAVLERAHKLGIDVRHAEELLKSAKPIVLAGDFDRAISLASSCKQELQQAIEALGKKGEGLEWISALGAEMKEKAEKCPFCNATIIPGGLYCNSCGKRVR
jgi:tetratricopeptide (TPR) repeat protein